MVGGLSRALDLTEGQPVGHAQRTVVIGMRIAKLLDVSESEQADLFYALLLKDAGCSASASRTAAIFDADDIALRADAKLVNFRQTRETLAYIARSANHDGGRIRRLRTAIGVAKAFKVGAQAIVAERCAQGAEIVSAIGLSPAAADTVASLEEHWDGGGLPRGIAGDQIPLLARIGAIAQCIDVFNQRRGRDEARAMVRARRGVAFDPRLADLVLARSDDDEIWATTAARELAAVVASLEPPSAVIAATDDRLDQVAKGFALVIDAKSPWTRHHSQGVAEIANSAATLVGMPADIRSDFRRAALLHDIGKLAVPSQILDKQAALTSVEFAQVKLHAKIGEDIIAGIPPFAKWASTIGEHHERLDGTGYPRGLTDQNLSPAARLLAVADVYDALTAARPYRAAKSRDEAIALLESQLHTGFCPEAFDAVRAATV